VFHNFPGKSGAHRRLLSGKPKLWSERQQLDSSRSTIDAIDAEGGRRALLPRRGVPTHGIRRAVRRSCERYACFFERGLRLTFRVFLTLAFFALVFGLLFFATRSGNSFLPASRFQRS
jgi:hypothetical protein